MKARIATVAMAILITSGITPVAAWQGGEWSFSGVDAIDVRSISGDVIIEAATGGDVTVVLVEEVRPEGAFRGEVEQQGATVRLREDWTGRNSSGRVEWTIRVPAAGGPAIEIDSASGDLEASGVEARIRLDTASGDVTLRGMTVVAGSSFETASGDYTLTDTTLGDDVTMETASGDIELVETVVGDYVELDTASGDVDLDGVQAGSDFEFSTASGNVTVANSTGVLEGSSASGNVRVRDSVLDGPSRFSSASGDVSVRLDQLPSSDMELSSASGDVNLEIGSFGDNFTLIMTKRQDRGRIDSPFPFTSEDTFERNDRVYEEKTVVRGSGQPEIRLRTASGSIDVRERS